MAHASVTSHGCSKWRQEPCLVNTSDTANCGTASYLMVRSYYENNQNNSSCQQSSAACFDYPQPDSTSNGNNCTLSAQHIINLLQNLDPNPTSLTCNPAPESAKAVKYAIYDDLMNVAREITRRKGMRFMLLLPASIITAQMIRLRNTMVRMTQDSPSTHWQISHRMRVFRTVPSRRRYPRLLWTR